MISFPQQLAQLRVEHEALIARPNVLDPAWHNGLFDRYRYPVVTAAHVETSPTLAGRVSIPAPSIPWWLR